MAELRTREPSSFLSKSDLVFMRLREMILHCVLEPGMTINQEQIAARLGVSVTPVREALRRLEMEGFVEASTHRAVLVTPLSVQELGELYESRIPLESLAARYAAERRTDEDVTEILSAVAAGAVASEGEDFLEASRRFHRAVYFACHNDVMIKLLDGLWDRSERYRRAVPPGISTDVLEEHREIADAVVARQPERAEELLRTHLQSGLPRITDSLQ